MAWDNNSAKTYKPSVYEIYNKWLQSTNGCERMDGGQCSNVQGHRNTDKCFDHFQITGKWTLGSQVTT